MAVCLYCRTQALDPQSGPSLWRRAIIDGEQILVCPDCQGTHPEWMDRAEACPLCESRRLYKSVGEKVCRSCGHQWSEERFEL